MASSLTPYQLLRRLLKRNAGSFAHALFWSIFRALLPMQVPILTGALIDGLTGHAARFHSFRLGGEPQTILYAVSFGLLIVALAYGLSEYLSRRTVGRVGKIVLAETRQTLLARLETMPLSDHKLFGASELISRYSKDTGKVRKYSEKVIVQTLTNVVRLGYPALALYWMNATLAGLVFVVFPVQWAINRFLQKRLLFATAKARATKSQINALVKENLRGIETIQALDAQELWQRRISAQNEILAREQSRSSIYPALMNACTWMMTSFGVALVWWQGGAMVLAGEMTVGRLVGFALMMRFVYRPFRRFTATIKTHAKSLVGLQRVVEILQRPAPARDTSASPVESAEGRLTLCRASFKYGNRQILRDLDLDLEAKRLIAIVGKSGAGKSTLLRLLARLLEPSSGSILLDGRDVSRLELASFRAHVAIVQQFPMIFAGTVAENMRIAKPDATDREIVVACEAAGALDCIDRLPQKFDTLLDRDGVKLSGGEVQRLALARALLRRPKVLLLDEPTSALDAESKLAIMATLQRLKNSMTVILTSHEMHWMRQSDHVVIMDNGEIVASGTHETLMSSVGAYRRLYDKKLIALE